MSLDISVRQQVENTLCRYALAVDDRDLAKILDIFAEDATFSVRIEGGELLRFAGHDGITQLMAANLSPDIHFRHIINNFVLREASGNSARSEAYLTLYRIQDGAVKLLTTGRYHDSWQQEDGVWRIRERLCEVDLAYL
jgi:3-phenylpropionate/cinnamic acid dioxygenase small subunit